MKKVLNVIQLKLSTVLPNLNIPMPLFSTNTVMAMEAGEQNHVGGLVGRRGGEQRK